MKSILHKESLHTASCKEKTRPQKAHRLKLGFACIELWPVTESVSFLGQSFWYHPSASRTGVPAEHFVCVSCAITLPRELQVKSHNNLFRSIDVGIPSSPVDSLSRSGKPFSGKDHLCMCGVFYEAYEIINLKIILLYIHWIMSPPCVSLGRGIWNHPIGLVQTLNRTFPTPARLSNQGCFWLSGAYYHWTLAQKTGESWWLLSQVIGLLLKGDKPCDFWVFSSFMLRHTVHKWPPHKCGKVSV